MYAQVVQLSTGSVKTGIQFDPCRYLCPVSWLQYIRCLANGRLSSIYYHFSVFFIIHPLQEVISLSANITTANVCAEAVNAIIALIRSYKSLYGLRRMPCSLSYLLFATGVAEPFPSPEVYRVSS